MNTLRQWLEDSDPARSWYPTLLFRASRDGWDASDFHKHCDNKGDTILVAKSADGRKIFGGYTDESWDSNSCYHSKYSSWSFLFVLTDNPVKMDILSGLESEAIYTGSSSNGPVFGAGHDLCIQGLQCTSYLGDTYECPSNLGSSFLECDLADYEVYQV